MGPSRVTLRDVAALAGVHYTTASRAMNPEAEHLVNPDTVSRVSAAAAKLHYTPDVIARSLRNSRTQTVGIVVPDVTSPTIGDMLRGAERVMRGIGYASLVVNSDDDPEREQQQLASLVSRRVDGIITMSLREDKDDYSKIIERGIPVVFANRASSDPRHVSVVADDVSGVSLGVEELVAQGHERIAFIGGPLETSTGRVRYVAFIDSLLAHGLTQGEGAVGFASVFSVAEGERIMTQLLERPDSFTAVFAANDLLAIGALSAMRRAAVRCPEDISLIGYNDMAFVEFLSPPLTTIRVDHDGIGEAAARALLAMLDDSPTEPLHPLPVELVRRHSVAAPRRASLTTRS